MNNWIAVDILIVYQKMKNVYRNVSIKTADEESKLDARLTFPAVCRKNLINLRAFTRNLFRKLEIIEIVHRIYRLFREKKT